MHVASDDGRLRPGATFPFMKYSPGRYGAHEASRPEPEVLGKRSSLFRVGLVLVEANGANRAGSAV